MSRRRCVEPHSPPPRRGRNAGSTTTTPASTAQSPDQPSPANLDDDGCVLDRRGHRTGHQSRRPSREPGRRVEHARAPDRQPAVRALDGDGAGDGRRYFHRSPTRRRQDSPLRVTASTVACRRWAASAASRRLRPKPQQSHHSRTAGGKGSMQDTPRPGPPASVGAAGAPTARCWLAQRGIGRSPVACDGRSNGDGVASNSPGRPAPAARGQGQELRIVIEPVGAISDHRRMPGWRQRGPGLDRSPFIS